MKFGEWVHKGSLQGRVDYITAATAKMKLWMTAKLGSFCRAWSLLPKVENKTKHVTKHEEKSSVFDLMVSKFQPKLTTDV